MQLPSSDEIIDDLAFFDDWEQRYQYIIDLGKSIPGLPEDAKHPSVWSKGVRAAFGSWSLTTAIKSTLT